MKSLEHSTVESLMFEPSKTPRVFALPAGVDFAQRLLDGIDARFGSDPAQIGRVELFVNTRRMQRNLLTILGERGARIFPRIRLITELALHPTAMELQQPASTLRRRLELMRFVTGLLEAAPDLAPRSAAFDLSISLSQLVDEVQGDGIRFSDIENLDVSDQSGHWERAQKFLRIIDTFFTATGITTDLAGSQRDAAEMIARHWEETPPDHPVIVAGSTGSRGATALFMRAVSRLPQGAIVLPGFDFSLPDSVWSSLDDPRHHSDHPQFLARSMMRSLDLTPSNVALWSDGEGPNVTRNALLSLALRPAPTTDQWRLEGPALGDLGLATDGVTYIEAPDLRTEAETIALGIRATLGEGKTIALVSPDRTLTRRVEAALGRWDIVPDDSAGEPLHLTSIGRFLRHILSWMSAPLVVETLLVTLKHPLCAIGGEERSRHIHLARMLERDLRRNGPALPTPETLARWAEPVGREAQQWIGWLSTVVEGLPLSGDNRPVSDHLDRLRSIAETLYAGPAQVNRSGIWADTPGLKAQKTLQSLHDHGDVAGRMCVQDFEAMLVTIFSGEEVRLSRKSDPRVRFLGTLEARALHADRVILAGLNEGVWPKAPSPDPWLNRSMRADLGLKLPDHQTGLSAHDFQQAFGSKDVWLCRSLRDDEADTIPSRWLNRLTNLLEGLEKTGGVRALRDMRARGQRWIAGAQNLVDRTISVTPAHRPSPRPPVTARPKDISVTQIKTLIRDPYAIYARDVLGLRPLDALNAEADARLRGILFHEIMEQFSTNGPSPDDPSANKWLIECARSVLAKHCPWPAIRMLWQTRFEQLVDTFLTRNRSIQATTKAQFVEQDGTLFSASVGVSLRARADRIDIDQDGTASIYDYKTGAAPSKKQQLYFDKQLLLQAAMLERGAFGEVGAFRVSRAAFIELRGDVRMIEAPLTEMTPEGTWTGFEKLMAHWHDPAQGYSAAMALFKREDLGPYAQLSRYGEWLLSDDICPEALI